jgi:protein-tyrosine phosphatase
VRCDARRLDVLREGAVAEADVVARASRLFLAACTGNLCRSPIAEVMLRSLVAERLGCGPAALAHHGFRFGSFGVLAAEGRPADDTAAEAARELGCDLAPHRSRPFSIALLEASERVYWLDRTHRDFLAPYFTRRKDGLAPLDPAGKDVPDPIGRPLRFHRKVAARIEEACRTRAEELVPEPAEEGGEGAGGPAA